MDVPTNALTRLTKLDDTQEQGRRGSTARLLARAALVAGSTALLLVVAIWNGYPLTYFDTFAYLADAFRGVARPEKALAYGTLIRLFTVMGSIWPLVVFQAVATLYVLWCLWRSFGFATRMLSWVACISFLCVATPLSWVVSYVMPDIFTALLMVCLYLLIFARESLGPVDRIAVPALFIVSTTVHNSNYLLSASVLGAVAAGAIGGRWVRPRLVLFPLALTGAALVVMVGLNALRSGEVFLARGGSTYLVNRMAEDGILQRLMADHCAERQYALCKFAPLPTTRQFLLFDRKSPLRSVGGWVGAESEMNRMIVDSLHYYPGANLLAALNQVGNQLRSFEIAEYTFPFAEGSDESGSVRLFLTGDYDDYRRSGQQTGAIASKSMAVLHAAVVWSCAFLGVLFSWQLHGDEARRTRSFIVVAWIALIANAAICGIFSHYEFRYQARLVWLVPLAAFLAWESSRGPRAGRALESGPGGSAAG